MKTFVFLSVLIFLFHSISICAEKAVEESFDYISPVSQMMFANLLVHLKDKIDPESRAVENSVIIFSDEERFISSLLPYLKKESPEINWKFLPLHESQQFDAQDTKAMIITDELSRPILSYLENSSARVLGIVISSRGKTAAAKLELNLKLSEVGIKEILDLKEIEYLLDSSGRQAIDLDLPMYQNMIFERLVRDGMNPVQAHPQAEEAIKKFRQTNETKVIIIGKLA